MSQKNSNRVAITVVAVSVVSFGLFMWMITRMPWYHLSYSVVQILLGFFALMPFIAGGIIAGVACDRIRHAIGFVLYSLGLFLITGIAIAAIWIDKAVLCFTFIGLFAPIGILSYFICLSGAFVVRTAAYRRFALGFAVCSAAIYFVGTMLSYMLAYHLLDTTRTQTTLCDVRAVPVWPAVLLFCCFLVLPHCAAGMVAGRHIADKQNGFGLNAFAYTNYLLLLIFMLLDTYLTYLTYTHYLLALVCIALSFIGYRAFYTFARRRLAPDAAIDA